MPQASDELRNKMYDRFGDPYNDIGPSDYLIVHGWSFERGVWYKEPMPRYDNIPQLQWDCIMFLVHEWDHAVRPQPPTPDEIDNRDNDWQKLGTFEVVWLAAMVAAVICIIYAASLTHAG